MKIGDIKVGEEYGVLDSRSTYRGGPLPRRVVVEEIVTEPKRFRSGYSYGPGTVRNVRRPKVRFLTEPQGRGRWGIDSENKGAVRVIDSRQVVALWSELEPGVRAKIEGEEKKEEMRAAMEARLDVIFPEERPVHVHASTDYDNKPYLDVRFDRDNLERIVFLAEKGLKAERVAQGRAKVPS